MTYYCQFTQSGSKGHVTPYQEGMLSYQEGVVSLMLGEC